MTFPCPAAIPRLAMLAVMAFFLGGCTAEALQGIKFPEINFPQIGFPATRAPAEDSPVVVETPGTETPATDSTALQSLVAEAIVSESLAETTLAPEAPTADTESPAPDTTEIATAISSSAARRAKAAFENLIGGDSALLLSRFGSPDYRRREGAIAIWQYRRGNCVFDFVLDDARITAWKERARDSAAAHDAPQCRALIAAKASG